MTNDFINGMFEFFGALAINTSTYTIVKDKCHAGVSKYNLLFFTTWN